MFVACEAGSQDGVEFVLRQRTHSTAERALARLAVLTLQSALVEVCTVAEGHRPVKLQIVGDARVVVISSSRVRLNGEHARHREVRLPASATAGLTRRAAWLVIYDEVADGLLHLVQVGPREMVPFLRQVVVGWA